MENLVFAYQVPASGRKSLRVVGDIRAKKSSQVSLIGEFVDVDTIRILYLHEYHSSWRDLASYVGLGLVTLMWAAALVRERKINNEDQTIS